MASDIWLRTILIVRKETRCCHIGYSYRLTARVLLYVPSHRQDSTYHSLCYTSRGALAGTRNSSMGPPHEGSIQQPTAPWANALTMELHLAPRATTNNEQCRRWRDIYNTSTVVTELTARIPFLRRAEGTDPGELRAQIPFLQCLQVALRGRTGQTIAAIPTQRPDSHNGVNNPHYFNRQLCKHANCRAVIPLFAISTGADTQTTVCLTELAIFADFH